MPPLMIKADRKTIHECAKNGDAQNLKQLISRNPDTVNKKDAVSLLFQGRICIAL